MFSDFQQTVNSEWKQRRQPVDPVRQRKKDLCVECGKQGFAVKMDYLYNRHITMLYTRYDVGISKCPKCGHVDKKYRRITGRGTSGANSGAMLGEV